MSELEDIKARAAERPPEQSWTMHSSCDEYRCQCHDDLDRAIAIAEELQKEHVILRDSTFNPYGKNNGWYRASQEYKKERDQARDDVKKLRNALMMSAQGRNPDTGFVLAETDREEYR